jgi:hypothetical protein
MPDVKDRPSAASLVPPSGQDGSAATDRTPLSRPARLIINTVAVIAISIGTVLMLEGGASVLLFVRDYMTAVAPTTDARPHTERDTLLGWINRPSFSLPDEYGRGIAFNTTAERTRGTGALGPLSAVGTRLICSGDSFTMGSGVPDSGTWCAQFHRFAPNIETVNMGQGMYGVDQAYLWYRRDGVRIPHQINVLALTYVQFERALAGTYGGRFKPNFTLDGNRLVLNNVPVPEQTIGALRRSYASSRLIEQLRLVQAVRRVSPRFDGTARQAQEVINRWPMFEAMFDQLDSLHRANGTQLVIAYLPTKFDARPGFLDERRRRLAEYTGRKNIPFFDLTTELRALPPDSLNGTFISQVEAGVNPGVLGHYTVAGGTWAAQQLARSFAADPKLRRFVLPVAR